MIATSLGSYRILEKVGAGGMGEVYRAHDARLNRDVALKVLPASFASDPDRLRRFTLEAQTAGGLNHPNVLTIYEIGSHDGQPFLASELLTGETLRAKLDQGPIPLSKALDYARQTAAGLAAAHARQITHRDIKPDNLFITGDGRVKILDFGLARQSGPATTASEDTRLETGTSPGVVLGTVGYMSPEQVRGQPVDHRSDLFSLGVVLYEMLSGTRPFARNSAVETMNAILTEDPPELVAPGRALPPALATVVRHCLEKQPDERFQSARDLAFALQAVSSPTSGFASGETTSIPATGKRERTSRTAVIASVSALAGAMLAAGALWFTRPAGSTPDLQHRQFTPLATDATVETDPAWSPDGRSLAYFSSVGNRSSLLVKDLDAPAPVTLVRDLPTRRTSLGSIFWWPDGTRVGFVDSAGAWVVSRAGGDPEPLQRGIIFAAALSPDGRTLAFWQVSGTESSRTAALWFASPPNGTPVKYTHAFADARVSTPVHIQYAPDGARLLISGFLPRPENRADESPGMWEISGTSFQTMGPPRQVFASHRWVPPAISWLPDGRRVVLGSQAPPGLWLGDIAPDTLTKITDGLSGERGPSVSPDGRRIAFEMRSDNYDTVDIPLDGSPIVDVLAANRAEFSASRARDGRIVYVSNESGYHQIRVRSNDGTDRAVVTPQDFPGETDRAGALMVPSVSPEGQRVLFARILRGQSEVWIAPMSGGTPVRAVEGGSAMMPAWSHDGRWIAFVAHAAGRSRLVRQRVGSSDPPQELVDMGDAFSVVAWSPDGRWIAHDHPDGVSVVAPDDGTRRVLAANARPRAIAWSADARTLYGLMTEVEGSRIVAIDAGSGAVRLVRRLPDDLIVVTPVSPALQMTLDASGTKLLTTVLRSQSDIWMMEGFER